MAHTNDFDTVVSRLCQYPFDTCNDIVACRPVVIICDFYRNHMSFWTKTMFFACNHATTHGAMSVIVLVVCPRYAQSPTNKVLAKCYLRALKARLLKVYSRIQNVDAYPFA